VAVIEDPRQALLLVVAQNVLLFVITVGLFWAGVFVARLLGRETGYSLRALGLSRPRSGVLVGIGVGMLVGFGTVILSAAINALSAVVLDNLGYSTESRIQQPLMQGLQGWVSENPTVAIPAIVSVVVLFGPAVEELVFRGAVFGGLYRLGKLVLGRLGGKGIGRPSEMAAFVGAALASSIVFAALHLEPVLLPALFVLSLVLCGLYRRTGSILPTFVAHATFNSFAALLVILSGLDIMPVPI
jgi:membrane protease YdiL (CAAX protease family)